MSITHDAGNGNFIALQKRWILAVAQLKSVLARTERSLRFARACQSHIDQHGHITPDVLDDLSRKHLGELKDSGLD